MEGNTADETANSQNIELTVRCTFTTCDVPVSCDPEWSIRRLKEHLHEVCPMKPAVANQRLIFNGACLTDDMIMKDIMKKRKVVEGAQVFHLVCPLPQSSPPELRRRERNVNADSTTPSNANGASPTSMPQAAAAMPQWDFAQFYQQTSGTTLTPQQMMVMQQYNEYYRNYMTYMMAYQQQAMAAFGGGFASPFFGSAMMQPNLLASARFVVPGANGDAAAAAVIFNRNGGGANAAMDAMQRQFLANVQQPQQPAAAAGNLNAAAPPMAAEPGVAAAQDVNVGQIDWIDLIYRTFRILLLVSAVLLYSSADRFLLVGVIALFIFGIQMWRNQQRGAAANAAGQGDQAAQPPQVNNNNHGEQGNNAGNGEQDQDAPLLAGDGAAAVREQSTLQVFLATCYTFVTSFFMSLVPDNQAVAMDLN